MTAWIEPIALWLADFYLLGTVLLLAALAALATLRQPAQRLALAKSTVVALVLLAVLTALPGWSVVHLATRDAAPVVAVAASRELPSASPVNTPMVEQPRNLQTLDLQAPAVPAVVGPRFALPNIAWTEALLSAYALGGVVIVVWLVLGAIAARRLLRDAEPAPTHLVERLNQIAVGDDKPPRLLQSDRVGTAVALGVLQPAVLLPREWATGRPADILAAVLAHEWTHIRNGDLRWMALGRALLVLLWAQPLYWLLRRRMGLDQEALADAAGAEISSREQYAEQLVAWARNTSKRPRIALSAAVGLWEGPSQLRRRLSLLLDERIQVLRSCSHAWRLSSAAATLLVASVLSLVTLRAEEQPPVSSADVADAAAQADRSADETESPVVTGTFIPSIDTFIPHMGEIVIGALPAQSTPPEPNSIAGRIVDENGQPLADIAVAIELLARDDATPQAVATTRTDADGRYQFREVVDIRRQYPDGVPALDEPRIADEPRLLLIARSPGRATLVQQEMQPRVASTGVVYDLPMPRAATYRGRVTGPDGQRVAGALVAVNDLGTRVREGIHAARTDAEGRYTIDDLSAYDRAEIERQQQAMREQQLKFAKDNDSNTFTAWFGINLLQVVVSHPDFARKIFRCDSIPGARDVRLEPAATMAGRVVDAAGAPVSAAKVWLAKSPPTADEAAQHETPQQFDADGALLHFADTTITDERGGYRFASLPANPYDVWVQVGEWQYPGLERVAAKAGETTNVPDLVVTKGGTIRVRLVDDATGEPIPLDGNVEAVFILFNDQIQHRPISRPLVRPTDGVFLLQAYPGRFRMMCEQVRKDHRFAWLAALQNFDDVPIVTTADGQTVDVELRMRKHERPKLSSLNATGAAKLQAGRQKLRDRKYQEVIDLATEVIQEDYPAPEAWIVRAEAREKLGQLRELIIEYERLIELNPPEPWNWIARNNLATLLATSRDDEFRDGPRAVEWAEQAVELSGEQTIEVYDTLAAAYAETGEFDKAAETLAQAIENFPAQARPELRAHVELYKSGRPLRWSGADAGSADSQ